jgi:hypothetical protein
MTRIQRTYDEDHQQMAATLTLAEYFSGVPLPSTQQKSEFAEFVSAAHSWYKHLPANLPGQPFYFFLDKYAGCDRRLQSNGTVVLADRREQGLHYSDIPTTEYRSRFGYLAYSWSLGTSVFVAEWPLVYSRDKVTAIPGDDGRMYGLPKEIYFQGLTELRFSTQSSIVRPLRPTRPFRLGEQESEPYFCIGWERHCSWSLRLSRIYESLEISRRGEDAWHTIERSVPSRMVVLKSRGDQHHARYGKRALRLNG